MRGLPQGRGLLRPLLLILLALSLVAGGSRPVGAFPHFVDGLEFDVDVRNHLMLPLLNPWVSFKNRGNVMRVTVRAPGYQKQVREIALATGQTVYHLSVVLADQVKDIAVIDPNMKRYVTAVINTDQCGFDPTVFGVVVSLPKKTLPNPDPKRIEVKDDVFFAPIKQDCTIVGREDFWNIRLTVDRASYDAVGHLMLVVIDRGPKPDPVPEPDETEAAAWITRLSKLERSRSADEATALAGFMAGRLPPAVLRTSQKNHPSPSTTLSLLLAERQRFADLHRE